MKSVLRVKNVEGGSSFPELCPRNVELFDICIDVELLPSFDLVEYPFS
jgi:hypothetical protein